MKLVQINEIKGKIALKSGLHIGSGDVEMKIGGTDNPVIKHPHTHKPYIPGSSLKGKVRSLLEMRSDLVTTSQGEPVSYNTLKKFEKNDPQKFKDCQNILTLFGASGADDPIMEKYALGPTRVSFADCPISEEWEKKQEGQFLPLLEVKSENTIDRIKGTAKNPRFTERVPAGVQFDFTITLKKFAEDEDRLEQFLLEGLKLLEMDAIGGSASRGYGRIQFVFDNKDLKNRFESIKPLPI